MIEKNILPGVVLEVSKFLRSGDRKEGGMICKSTHKIRSQVDHFSVFMWGWAVGWLVGGGGGGVGYIRVFC